MPATYGGGAKEHKKQGVQAQVAQLCLANGYSLEEATAVSAKLVQQAGQPQLSKALGNTGPAQQWDHILSLIDKAAQEVAARVTRRAHAQARKKHLFNVPM